ncbi:unnamed protein product [Ambrosiozyma monospora]|uniref:Unnamed protein product n=1 Tax=Ambrosiozyma monospora TaxID=43982 RepID=A0A9W6T8X3_AMBMO|nr:unnamed protein product [Ambrosiozyma monospora]
MRAEDTPTGNSIQDFEKWRLKMRIETAKRNGEPVSEEDTKQYEYLCSLTDKSKTADEGKKDEPEESKPVTGTIIEEELEPEGITDDFPSTIPTSIDDFVLPSLTSSKELPHDSSTSSRFSSFFVSPPEKAKPSPPAAKASRLMSLMGHGEQSASPSPESLHASPKVESAPAIWVRYATKSNCSSISC